MGCLDHPFRLRWFVYSDILQFDIRLQANCSQLGSSTARYGNMRQQRGNLYCYGCDRYRDGCDADGHPHSDRLGIANGDETEDWTDNHVLCWINVSVHREGKSRYEPMLTPYSTMVTSIIRLIVLIPALTDMDQTWIIAVGCLWM